MGLTFCLAPPIRRAIGRMGFFDAGFPVSPFGAKAKIRGARAARHDPSVR